mmetsp:Transcript_67759/g.107374  ORF Transcript_67759/g.107374 Transcript_67759/m.107374 type:complete len:80 (-) Transcript_67759:1062-1301(-)
MRRLITQATAMASSFHKASPPRFWESSPKSLRATLIKAFLSLRRRFFSSLVHKWQNSHCEPLAQPTLVAKAHGLHRPKK